MRALGFALVLAFAGFLPSGEAAPGRAIHVDSNDDWLRLGVPGNGSKESPFIVEGLRIDLGPDAQTPGISIRNVPTYAIIRHVLVVGGKVGVVLVDSKNVTVENVSVVRAITGFEVRNARLDHVSTSGTVWGIRSEASVVTNSVVRDSSEYGLFGTFVRVENTTFAGNGYAIYMEEEGRIRSPTKPLVKRVLIEGARSAGILATSDLQVANATFRDNYIGLLYRGTANLASVKGSSFGTHTNASVVLVRPKEATWKLDARGNWWGHESGPSPRGFGSPVLGAVDYVPLKTEPPGDAMPFGAPGASFPDSTEPPTIADDGSVLVALPDAARLILRLKVTDPDGVASWTLVEADHTVSGTSGKSEESVTSTLDLPAGTQSVEVRLTASDYYGNTASFNTTVRLPPPPEEEAAEEEAGEDERPPPKPLEPQKSPGATLAAVVAAAVAAAVRPRVRPPRA